MKISSFTGGLVALLMLIAAPARAMMFKSDLVYKVWDNWAYYDNGTFYLYYLIENTPTSGGDGFGVATSKDGVHWTDYGPRILPSDKMVNYLGTGSVWKSVDFATSGRYLCNYSEWRKDPVSGRAIQNILFAWSTDLIHWNKLGDESIFKADPRYYDPLGRWDCIYAMPRDEGGYWGTWTATSKPGDPKGTIGIGWTDDGLHWNALPAPLMQPGVNESGAFWKFGQRIYAMFGEGGNMWAYSADKVTGPYVRATKNARLLPAGFTYFSRFCPLPDGSVLVNHQVRSDPSWFIAPFKLATVDDEGTLRLKYWPGNDAMKGDKIDATLNDSGKMKVTQKTFDLSAGMIAEGTIKLPATGKEPVGLLVSGDGPGIAMHLWADGHAEFGKLDPRDGTWNRQLESYRDLAFGDTAKFRLLARRGMAELYINDYLVECYTMVGFGSLNNVRLGILGDSADSPVGDLQLWQMSLPGNPKAIAQLTASSEYPATKQNLETFVAANAMDGDPDTRWCSVRPSAPTEWLQLDFGATRKINKVKLQWQGDAYASEYQLEVSDDAQTWTPISRNSHGNGGDEKRVGLNGSGRYLRIVMTKHGVPTVPCYSLWEVKVE